MMEENTGKFSIEIIKQEWLTPDIEKFDLCSHGYLVVKIGGKTIVNELKDYGLSESALALLRTTKTDHTPQNPLAERMIFHGCGITLMMGCYIGADWTVLHEDGQVTIKDIIRWDYSGPKDAVCFGDLSVTMPLDEYKAIVFAFAREVKAFFEGKEKAFYSEEDRIAYEDFWAEFDALLAV